jgi:hydroxyacylglutathione hydrolase
VGVQNNVRFDGPVPADLRARGQGGFTTRTKCDVQALHGRLYSRPLQVRCSRGLQLHMILRHFPVGPIACNCVILGDEATKIGIVVDPGDEVENIFKVLREHDLKLAAIVATHAHIDHVGALAELKQRTGAPIMMHEADIPLYENIAVQAAWLGIPAPSTADVDGYLRESQAVHFGLHALRAVHTPGHTPGSVSFVIEEREPIILSGDTLFAGSIGRTDLWGGSFTQIMQSIRSKLLAFEDDVAVIPGHGPQTTIGTERRTNPFIQQT